mmetsp:Transcript_87952/g.249277  ORF Transcript_87952/g.249277 Transcript_87952/m.249277 type:complete len:118 (+) Transcript_87952:80-433(+)
MPEIGSTGVAFTKVAREWRCKYAMDATGGPAESVALKAAQALLVEYLPTLKALPNAEVTRVVCGGCGDFKVIVNQPAADHGAWAEKKFAPEEEFVAKLKAIEGCTQVETQEFTMEAL